MNYIKALESIRDTPVRLFVACTGAGARLQGRLWDIPGASSFLAGGLFPYAGHESDEFLGYRPTKYCSMDTAIELAMAAYMRAQESVIAEELETGKPCKRMALGLGLTASVASKEIHRGDHRVFVATMSDLGVQLAFVRLPKGAGLSARETDGEVCDLIGLNAILSALAKDQLPISFGDSKLDLSELGGNINIVSEPDLSFTLKLGEVVESELRRLFFLHPVFLPSGRRIPIDELDVANTVFLPGSFNPIHKGHRSMAGVVERETGLKVAYMTTADAPHKPILKVSEMLQRATRIRMEKWEGQKCARTVVFMHGDPLFLDKAKRFPNTGFVIGADTMLRMLDPVWGPAIEPLLEAFFDLGTRFYVFGRHVAERGFTTASDIEVAVEYRKLFKPLDGRWDISSTELRGAEALNG